MTLDFAGRSALVTGGTRGIGYAIAVALRDAGARVVITGTGPDAPEALADLLKSGEVSYAGVDFLDDAASEKFAERMAGEEFDVLVNNAGINRVAPLDQVALKDWDDIQRVNVRAPMLLSRRLLPRMMERGYGRIVNITSIFGHVSRAGRSSYTTSKFALLGLTKTIAIEAAAADVLCNAVAPGFIDTELTRRILTGEQMRELAEATPIRRLGRPEEIALLVLFLASSANTFTTGQLILADGGFTSV